jgi:hypothetical protein
MFNIYFTRSAFILYAIKNSFRKHVETIFFLCKKYLWNANHLNESITTNKMIKKLTLFLIRINVQMYDIVFHSKNNYETIAFHVLL